MNSGLYIVSLPIGNLGDMTFRAVEVLNAVDEVWAEDTRNLRKILNHFDIDKSPRQLKSCHDHNESAMAGQMVEMVRAGGTIAYVSDAGMPLISDPGYRLVQAAQEAGIYYTVLPGASAVPTALALSGLPTDRFAFLGFVPNKDAKRREFFEHIREMNMTVLAFESPRRVHASLAVASEIFDDDMPVAIVREISKKFEEVLRGSLSDVFAQIRERELKGEIVLAFGAMPKTEMTDDAIEAELTQLLASEHLKDAVKIVSEKHKLPRNRVYQLALQIKNQS